MDTQKLAALYARISVKDWNVPKVEDQLTNLRQLALSRGLTVVDEYKDDGISAHTGDLREDYERLRADLAAGQFGVILATEEARLARDETEKDLLALDCITAGATRETIRDGAVNPVTASGRLMPSLRGAIDAFESRRKAERQRCFRRGDQSSQHRDCFAYVLGLRGGHVAIIHRFDSPV